jgi:sugar phosphate isomerase/epimerase
MAKLRKRMVPYWQQVQDGVKQILPYAREKGVRLMFENRERFEELPVDADFTDLFNTLPPDAPVGYWHDTGHAQIKQNLGVLDHRQHLEKNAPRLVGFHLHDVNAEGQDHQPVGTGKIDFKMVSGFWRPEHRLTLELGPRVSVDDVRTSKSRIEELIASLG